METKDYLRILVEDIHSCVVATIDENGHPITRVIDMMLYDEKGVYFLTAKGKVFYEQLMNQKYISLSCVKGQKSISLSGHVRNIGHEKLDEIFEKNPYMKKIYPKDTRNILQVFILDKGEGQFFDISDPSHITRGLIQLGDVKQNQVAISSHRLVFNVVNVYKFVRNNVLIVRLPHPHKLIKIVVCIVGNANQFVRCKLSFKDKHENCDHRTKF